MGKRYGATKMPKTVQEQLAEFAGEVRGEAARAKTGEIGWVDAAKGAWARTRHFASRLVKGPTSHERKKAIETVKKGISAYNAKNYPEAERLFRRAIERDSHYARAYAYLGNTLYKQKRFADAMSSWQKAIHVEPGSDAAEMAQEKIQHILSKGKTGIDDIDIEVKVVP